jgi:hypothetical protein
MVIHNMIIIWKIVIIYTYMIYVNSSFIQIKNNILRIYLRNNEKQKIRNVNRFYHLLISKIYDVQLFYYKLTEEEKDILDAIWSLCY